MWPDAKRNTTNISKESLHLFSKTLKATIASSKSHTRGHFKQVKSLERVKPPVQDTSVDDGTSLLYSNLAKSTIFKTSNRLLDEILCDIPYINSFLDDGFPSLLNSPTISYSKKRKDILAYKMGVLTNGSILQTKFEYKSKTCPQHNSISEIFGVLIPESPKVDSFESYYRERQIHHVKISVKRRSQLELRKKHAAVTYYFKVDSLHEYDKEDFIGYDPAAANIIDSAIYVSDDTNKVIIIEIFKPEFPLEDKIHMFGLKELSARSKNKQLSEKHEPDQLDVLNTLVYCFKEHLKPVIEKSTKTPISLRSKFAIDTDLDLKWVSERFNLMFKVKHEKLSHSHIDLATHELASNDRDISSSKQIFDGVTRQVMELLFLGKAALRYLTEESYSNLNKDELIFTLFSTNFSNSIWSQTLGEYRSILESNNISEFDTDENFINLSASFSYSEKDILQNYEIQISLDEDNIDLYYCSLKFISTTLSEAELLTNYCKANEVVGKPEFEKALQVIGIEKSLFTDSSDIELWNIYSAKHKNLKPRKDLYLLEEALHVLAIRKKSETLTFISLYRPYRNIFEAYLNLDIEEGTDIETVNSMYMLKSNEHPHLKKRFDRSLFYIAMSTKSLALLHSLYEKCIDFHSYITTSSIVVNNAFDELNATIDTTDDKIIENFEILWSDKSESNPVKILNLFANFQVIVQIKKSKLLRRYIESGFIDYKYMSPEKCPIGLNNIGNTCYLNSLLQYYFSIKPLRAYIEKFGTLKDLNTNIKNLIDTQILSRRIGGRVITDKEIYRSIQFVLHLRKLFLEMIFSSSRKVTPNSQLAYLAFAPTNLEIEFDNKECLSTSNSLSEEESNNEHNSNFSKGKEDKTVKQRYVVPNITGNLSTLAPKISSTDLENILEIGSQQDVTECIGNVLFQIETASDPIKLDKDDEQIDLIKELFYGKTEQHIFPINKSSNGHTKTERFLLFLVSVSDEPLDIYEAFDVYFKDEYLKMEEYGDVKKTLSISEFPKILQIQIQRVYYNREKLTPFKSTTLIPFDQTIYLDRYANDASETLLSKRATASTTNKKIKNLRDERNKLITNTYLVDQEELIKQNEILSNKIVQLKQKIDFEFGEYNGHAYTLFTVFIHRGQATFGHYWIYINDIENNGIWWKCNDHMVTEVPEFEVFNFIQSNVSTPYFLVYIDKQYEHDIQPLERDRAQ